MPMLDVFDQDGFSLLSLTAAINQLPEVPTLIGDLNVFEENGVDTIDVAIEKRDESLTLVGTSPRGGPGETVGGESRNIRSFRIPHIQRDDAIMADEVQGKRAFGTENVLESVMSRVAMKMQRHTRSFDLTLENMRMGAINGVVTDKNGATLFNLFTEFGVTQPTELSFALGTATTDVRGKCRTILDAIGDALEGEMVRRVYGLSGDDFFHALVTHPKVEDTYKNWEAAVALRGDPRLPFEFGGITWVRYHTKPKARAAKVSDGSGGPMIAADKVKFVAAGVPELFITRFGPADYEETVNTTGLPRYARQYAMPNGKGRSLEMQSNPICLCTRPEVLQRGRAN